MEADFLSRTRGTVSPESLDGHQCQQDGLLLHVLPPNFRALLRCLHDAQVNFVAPHSGEFVVTVFDSPDISTGGYEIRVN
jgi:hypothetical protein